MNGEYRLAAYAAAVSLVVLAISGAIVVAGDAPTDPSQLSATDTDRPDGTEHTDRNLTVETSDRIELSVAGANGTVTFNGSRRTCRGDLRVGDANRTRTDVELDGVTVTLIEDHAAPFDEIDRTRFAELVWEEVSGHAGLANHDHVEIRINQYYETVDREEPLDTVGVHARPVDACLPTVEGEVTLENRSVDVRAAHPDLEDLELGITDSIGVLGDDERALVERLLESDPYASYTIQAEFDEPAQLNATVREATNDGEIELAVRSPTVEGRTVLARIDLDSETVLDTWTRVSLDSEGTDTVAVGDTNGNGTVTFEVTESEDGE